MQLNLSELLTVDGRKKEYQVPLEMAALAAPGGEYPLKEAHPTVTLHILHTKNRQVVIDATAAFSLLIPCDRCLTPVETSFSLDFQREVDFNASEEDRAEALDEQPYVIGYELDVDRLVEDELLSVLPMKVLCREDCKGLCRVCGGNLNLHAFSCDDHSSEDPRMSVIRDIFNNYKEV